MAIVGVRTELTTTIQATTLETGLVWWMDNGTTKGQSSDLPVGTATNYLGKALNFVGNQAASREIRVAKNGRQ